MNKKQFCPLILGAVFVLAGCAHSPVPVVEQQDKAALPSQFIDLHAHVNFDARVSQAMNAKVSSLPEGFAQSYQDARFEKVGLIVMARRGDVEGNRIQNDKLLALTRADKRIVPICSVHPLDGEDAIAELDRLAELGVRFIKMHPNTQKFDVGSPDILPVIARAAEHRMVLLFDAWSPFDSDQTGKFLMLALQNPQARFILAHMGGSDFLDMMVFNVMDKYPWYPRNVWFDLSASSNMFVDSPYQEKYVWVARQLGVDRLIFGSDFPLVKPEDSLNDMERLGFTSKELQKIMYTNAQELLSVPK